MSVGIDKVAWRGQHNDQSGYLTSLSTYTPNLNEKVERKIKHSRWHERCKHNWEILYGAAEVTESDELAGACGKALNEDKADKETDNE